MFFTVIAGRVPSEAEPRTAYLIRDNWNDWFTYVTMFTLVVVDDRGEHQQAGSVKIGRRGMNDGDATPNIPDAFDALSPEFFSLGQDETYYETLNLLSEALKARVLDGLRDVALDLDLFAEFEGEEVMGKSLLRDRRASTVRGRLHRLALGDARLTEFHFSYTLPEGQRGSAPPTLTFDVHPESQPPTNVHVLIGRNGVGKTRFMQGLAQALLQRPNEDGTVGAVAMTEDGYNEASFIGLVLVSFSAFDDFDLATHGDDPYWAVQVGLRMTIQTPDGDVAATKSPHHLTRDFVASFDRCRVGLRAARWRKAVETLGADDLFRDSDVVQLLDLDEDEWRPAAERVFSLLSSGHKIVLLTVTLLVQYTDERTLVLLDEPEAHLHPPLLSAFVRSLSDLLVSRNGAAVVATHSPVVLQEVPRSCTWVIRRSGDETRANRPEQETFAENVSDLTREVFGLEITKSGFHQLVAEAVADRDLDYEGVLARFEGQLGAEGRALARALIAERDSDGGL